MANEGWRDADTQKRDLQSGCERQLNLSNKSCRDHRMPCVALIVKDDTW